VRHLLNHTSGLSELGDPNASTYAPTLASQARTLRHVCPIAPVGTKYQYYNKNYDVLGLLIEQASGQAYADYVREHIFAPLGMTRTVADPADAPDLAQGYSQVFGWPVPYPMTFHPGAAPSGYLISNVEDMARYLIAQINDGRTQDHALVQPATLAQMRTPPAGIGSSYGMGWMVVEDGNMLFHGGDLEGFHAVVAMGLKEKIGFVILCNQNSLPQILTVYDALPGELSSLLMGKAHPTPTSFAWVGLVLAILMAADFLNHLRLFLQLPAWANKTARQSRAVQWLKISPGLVIALALLVWLPSLLGALFGSSGNWLDIFGLLPDLSAWLLIGLTLVLIRGVAKIILLARQPVLSL
jgi:CubicO group peptidase (beta-lactamase class C family)